MNTSAGRNVLVGTEDSEHAIRRWARRRLNFTVASALTVLSFVAASGLVACNKEPKRDDQAAQANTAAAAAREAEQKAAAEKQRAEGEAAKVARIQALGNLQKQIDAADRKIEYLKDKVNKAKGATKKNADAAVAELDKRRAAVVESMKKLEDDQLPTWDAVYAEAAPEAAALDQSVNSLEQTLSPPNKVKP
jgi:uncharacterized protein YPO0396